MDLTFLGLKTCCLHVRILLKHSVLHFHEGCFGEQNWIQGTVNIIAFVESLWVYTTQSLALQACDYTHQEQRECEITACLPLNLYDHHQFPQNMPNTICIQSGSARKHWPEVGWMTLAHQLASRLDPFN